MKKRYTFKNIWLFQINTGDRIVYKYSLMLNLYFAKLLMMWMPIAKIKSYRHLSFNLYSRNYHTLIKFRI